MKPGQTLQEAIQEELHEDSFPSSQSPNIKTNDVIYMVIDKQEICTAYTDHTGRFPCKSSSGNEYVIIPYHYDANLVMGRAIKIENPKQSLLHGKPCKTYLAKLEFHHIHGY